MSQMENNKSLDLEARCGSCGNKWKDHSDSGVEKNSFVCIQTPEEAREEIQELEAEIRRLRAQGASEPARPLFPGEIIEAGDEAYQDGIGPWIKVSEARIDEMYRPWNGDSGIHVTMRRPFAPPSPPTGPALVDGLGAL